MPVPDDDALVEIFLDPVRLSAQYRPAFGQESREGLDYDGFEALYGADAFYAWLGLVDPALYAAHRAAGGMSSVYRQIGTGSERLMRAILGGALGLSDDQLDWSYTYLKDDGGEAVHHLDACIRTPDLADSEVAERMRNWISETAKTVPGPSKGSSDIDGVVMEIRQGYKSADAKRQNADLRFGMRAYQADLLPAVVVMSTQVSIPVIRRYRADGILVLTGTLDGTSATSTFKFVEEAVGYDLAAFMERNSERLSAEVKAVIKTLLSTS